MVSRQVLIDSKFSTVVCAPVYSRYDGLSTQVPAGVEEGLKHESSVHCDELVSLPKAMLTRFVGRLWGEKLRSLDYGSLRLLTLNRKLWCRESDEKQVCLGG